MVWGQFAQSVRLGQLRLMSLWRLVPGPRQSEHPWSLLPTSAILQVWRCAPLPLSSRAQAIQISGYGEALSSGHSTHKKELVRRVKPEGSLRYSDHRTEEFRIPG